MYFSLFFFRSESVCFTVKVKIKRNKEKSNFAFNNVFYIESSVSHRILCFSLSKKLDQADKDIHIVLRAYY